MKNKKIIIAIAIIAVIAVIIYFATRKKQTETPIVEPISDQNKTSPGWKPASYPLEKGMQGDLVSRLQIGLNTNCGANISVDGKFGDETYRAVKNAGFGYPVGVLDFIAITKENNK